MNELIDMIQIITGGAAFFGLLAILSTLELQATTLKLQQKQLGEQQEITKIEQQRFKLEIRPEINATMDWDKHRFTFLAENHDMVDCLLVFREAQEGVKFRDNYFPGEKIRLTKNTALTTAVSWKAHLLDQALPMIQFAVYYSDAIGTNYIGMVGIKLNLDPIIIGPIEIKINHPSTGTDPTL